MSAFKVTPGTTAHAFTMLDMVAIAAEQLRAALAHKDARIAELEGAIDKLAACKGRFHTEANFKALMQVRDKQVAS